MRSFAAKRGVGLAMVAGAAVLFAGNGVAVKQLLSSEFPAMQLPIILFMPGCG